MAHRFNEKNFGILDIDICGPSQPRMMGVLGEQVHQSGSGWSPVYIEDNLSVMSIGFLLGSQDDAIIWRVIWSNFAELINVCIRHGYVYRDPKRME